MGFVIYLVLAMVRCKFIADVGPEESLYSVRHWSDGTVTIMAHDGAGIGSSHVANCASLEDAYEFFVYYRRAKIIECTELVPDTSVSS